METDSLARTEPAFHTNEKARLLSTLTTNLDYVIFAGLAIGAFALAHWLMRRRQVKMRPVVWVLGAAFLGMGAWLVDDAGQRERTRIVAMARALQVMGGAQIAPGTPQDDPANRATIETMNTCIAAARGARIVQLAMLLALVGTAALFKRMLHADIGSRQQVEADLRRSQKRLALRAEQTPLAVIEWDLDLRVVDWNAAAERLFGYSRAEAVGAAMLGLLAPAPVRAEIAGLCGLRAEEDTAAISTDAPLTKHGGQLVCAWTNAALVDGDRVIGVTSLCEDITGRRKLEEQLRQSQKMEAFGQLAGGIAHDFNNMLCAITGFTDIVRNRTDVPTDAVADLDQVAGSAERAAALTRQLLTFSQRQIFQPRNVSLGHIVEDVAKMLHRVLGDDVNLATNLIPKLPEIHADAAMIEQALVKLAVNARDAMPSGGRLVIATGSRFVGEEEAALHPGIAPGPFVCLEVSDSGCGIPPEHLARIYDPFFTTKEIGRGTGLGLATVYGIVQQHTGWIAVESEPGRGTTFRIFFPAVADAIVRADPQPEAPPARGGTETILVVEDEIPVRDFVSRLLKSSGYDVLTAASGIEALAVWRDDGGRIDMLITDMIMPDGFSGADLARRLRQEDSDLKIIYTSGYSMDFVSRKLVLMPGINFLQKPYMPDELIRMVRENLDGKPDAVAV